MRKLSSKKILYIFLVIALNLILFIRSTQYEAVFTPFSLCTGPIVLMFVFATVPLKKLFNVFNVIFSIICFAATLAFVFLRKTGRLNILEWTGLAYLFNIWTIGLGIIYIIKGLIKKEINIRLNVTCVLWIAFSAAAILSRSDRIWPLWFLLVFGIYYIIPLKKNDLNEIASSIVDGTIIGFFAIQCFAFLFRPFDEIRYKGAFYNSNDMGIYYSTVFLMVLVKMYGLRKASSHKIFKYLLMLQAGALVSFQFFTSCRTAWINTLFIGAVYIVIVLIIKNKESFKSIAIKVLAMLLCIMISFPLVFVSIRYLPCVHPHPIWFWDEWNEGKVHSWDPADSEKYTDIDEVFDRVSVQLARLGIVSLDEDKNEQVSRENMARERDRSYEEIMNEKSEETEVVIAEMFPGKKLDDILSKRLTIYKAYLSDATLFGKRDAKTEFYMPLTDHNGDVKYHRIWHAQNFWVQGTWSFGIFAGIILIALTVMAIIGNISKGCKSENIFGLLALLITLEYFCIGMVEITWLPGQLIFVLVFLVQKNFYESVPEDKTNVKVDEE